MRPALIPLHAQPLINELLSEEKGPRVSVKHTRIFLTTHTLVSPSALGHRPAAGFKTTPRSLRRGGTVPMLQRALPSDLSSVSIKWWAPAPPALTLRLHAVGNEGLLLSLWLLIHADRSRPALWPKPATWEAPSHVLYPIQLTSNRKRGLRGALLRRGIVARSGTAREQQMLKETESTRNVERIADRKQSRCQETHFLCLSSSSFFILLHKSICLSSTQSFEFTTRNLLRSPETIPVQRTLKKFGGAFVCERGGPAQAEAAIRRSGHN